ncbi:MAG TPA: hypothetical protein VGC41_28375 [Kofleriaceae bacterium]
MRKLALGLLGLAAACSGDDTTTPDARKSCPTGDLGAAPQIELYQDTGTGSGAMIQAMDSVPLIQPPQGGWVFYVVPRISNMDACGIQLATSLVDTVSGQVVVFESRPSTLMDDGNGWAVAINEGSYGLVAACPQVTPSRDLDNETYTLTVTATDTAGRMATTSIPITPTCSDSFCTCQCAKDYQLGQVCP